MNGFLTGDEWYKKIQEIENLNWLCSYLYSRSKNDKEKCAQHLEHRINMRLNHCSMYLLFVKARRRPLSDIASEKWDDPRFKKQWNIYIMNDPIKPWSKVKVIRRSTLVLQITLFLFSLPKSSTGKTNTLQLPTKLSYQLINELSIIMSCLWMSGTSQVKFFGSISTHRALKFLNYFHRGKSDRIGDHFI